jgi:nicotinate-nucleotide adenylyltransferase
MIGIYGGTFDPIHNGHIIMATSIVELSHLDKIIIMPTRTPPHKQGMISADFERRLRWSQIAFENVDKVEISDFEGKKDVSYTIDTVLHFEKIYGKVAYIMGEDSFTNIEKWYKYAELIERVELYIYPRYCDRHLTDDLMNRMKKSSERIHFLSSLPIIQISSTSIRERARLGLSLKGYVPDKLEKEIFDFYKYTPM